MNYNRGFIQYSRGFNERLQLIQDKKKEKIVLGVVDTQGNLLKKVAFVWEDSMGGRYSKVELLSGDWKDKFYSDDLSLKIFKLTKVAPTVQEFMKYLSELKFKDMTRDGDESLPF